MVRKQRRTSTWALVVWGLVVLAAGLGVGFLLGNRGCGRREAPARTAPSREGPTHPLPGAHPRAARPAGHPAPSLPKLALVIDDLGYMPPELVTRLCSLPIPLTVAVLPYQEYSRESAEIAHRMGKQVMLHLPMEPIGYPAPGRDPGPNAILYNLPEAEVRRRVRMALEAVPFRAGVNNHMGSRITPDRTRMTWVLQEIKASHCFFVDSRTEKDSVAYAVAEQLGVPAVQRKVFLDDDKSFAAESQQWDRALALARKDGSVLMIGHIYPETVGALEKLVPRAEGQVQFVTAGELAH